MHSDDYKKGYGRGYQTASNRWPEHRPPHPPDPVVRLLFDALRELRDTVDGQMATFGEDDEVARAFDAPIAKADAAMVAVTKWLRDSSTFVERLNTSTSENT